MLHRLINKKGFTLIEIMIVIAIIGILAAIAIPNFLSYRAKSYCSAVESDAIAITGAIADYFSNPEHTSVPEIDDLSVTFTTKGGQNTGSIGGSVDSVIIIVTDGSQRCPTERMPGNTYGITIQ